MKIDSVFVPTRFRDMPPGTFFKALRRDDPFFGLAVLDEDGDRGSLIFARQENKLGLPWLANGDLSYDSIVALPDALLRPDLSSAASAFGSLSFGHLIHTDQGGFIKASVGMGTSAIFNIENGKTSKVSESHIPLLTYSRWTVGVAADEGFAHFFEFPPAVTCSPETPPILS